jgi:membrane protease YdiL (CAAX protease family)
VASRTALDVDSLSPGRLVTLALAPGALGTLVYVALAGVVEQAGFPPITALFVAIVVVIIPFELGVVLLASRSSAGGGPFASIPYREPIAVRDWIWLAPVVFIASLVGFGLVGVVEPGIRDALFGWVPGWFRDPVPLDAVAAYSRSAWIVTLVAYWGLNVLAGPIVEELYFRGYVLPRMARYGRWAPLLNAVLFSLYHFWSPWQLLSRIAGVTPFAYAAWWKRNVYIGMVVHVTLNAIGTASVTALVLQRLG